MSIDISRGAVVLSQPDGLDLVKAGETIHLDTLTLRRDEINWVGKQGAFTLVGLQAGGQIKVKSEEVYTQLNAMIQLDGTDEDDWDSDLDGEEDEDDEEEEEEEQPAKPAKKEVVEEKKRKPEEGQGEGKKKKKKKPE
eukprot:NODE_9501_length_586_cov_83.704104_g8865_i0.p1 GENE.NODE_9501_length_586_cov_83.704104_g8865_i0~~NODE_9501_length_586_cov_83.704104_g8865_i0.p1  ORF type:complete len:158 (-),score=69.13 NODE_9501_length_586_cov_83.704104_g8865_i0:113-526(-)